MLRFVKPREKYLIIWAIDKTNLRSYFQQEAMISQKLAEIPDNFGLGRDSPSNLSKSCVRFGVGRVGLDSFDSVVDLVLEEAEVLQVDQPENLEGSAEHRVLLPQLGGHAHVVGVEVNRRIVLKEYFVSLVDTKVGSMKRRIDS